MRKLSMGLYGLSIFIITVGLIFYHYVFIDDNIFSYLSELLYQRRSAYVIYGGLALFVVTFFLSNDFMKMFLWIKKMDKTNSYTKIIIGITLIAWLINIIVSPTFMFYYRTLVMICVTVFIGIKTHKLIYTSILLFVIQFVDHIFFIYAHNRAFDYTWILTIGFFIYFGLFLTHLIFFLINLIKKRNYMKYLFILLFQSLVFGLILVENHVLSFSWSSSNGGIINKESGYIWIELIVYLCFAIFIIHLNKKQFKLTSK